MIALIFHMVLSAQAEVPIASESVQLQRLINKSEQQLQALKELLKNSDADRDALARASGHLEKLTEGIDQSVKQYEGTEAYERALVNLHAKENFKHTYYDSQVLNQKNANSESEFHFDQIVQFQKDSVKANQSDLDQQKKLRAALSTAPPGLVSKLQVQAELGNWRAQTRLSTQITELIAAIHSVREELRTQRVNSNQQSPINTFLTGSEILNRKQKEKQGQ